MQGKAIGLVFPLGKKRLKVQLTSISPDIHTSQFATHITHCSLLPYDWQARQCDVLFKSCSVIQVLDFWISLWEDATEVSHFSERSYITGQF